MQQVWLLASLLAVLLQDRKKPQQQKVRRLLLRQRLLYSQSNGEVENEQSFESMGIHMVAPADGENTKFYTISGEVAEITFDENGVSYCYRASNTAEDFAGIFERFTDQELAVNLGVWQNSRTGPGKDHRKRRKTGFMVLGQHTLYRIHCLCHFRRRVYPGGYQFNGIKLSRIMDLG